MKSLSQYISEARLESNSRVWLWDDNHDRVEGVLGPRDPDGRYSIYCDDKKIRHIEPRYINPVEIDAPNPRTPRASRDKREKTPMSDEQRNKKLSSLFRQRDQVMRDLAELQMEFENDSNIIDLSLRGEDPMQDKYYAKQFKPLFDKLEKIEAKIEELS